MRGSSWATHPRVATPTFRNWDLPQVRTEIRAKFAPERLYGDLATAGLRPTDVLTDPDDLYALSLSERSAA